jgi:hypothetical protein
MEHLASRAAARPARESDTTFRKLVEKKITVDEYVADIERRVEKHENGKSSEDRPDRSDVAVDVD